MTMSWAIQREIYSPFSLKLYSIECFEDILKYVCEQFQVYDIFLFVSSTRIKRMYLPTYNFVIYISYASIM